MPSYCASVSVANAAAACINTIIYGWSGFSAFFAICAVAVIICSAVSIYSKRFHLAATAALLSIISFVEFPLLIYHYGAECAIYFSLALIGIMFCVPKKYQLWFAVISLIESAAATVLHYALSYLTVSETPYQNMCASVAAVIIVLIVSFICYRAINGARTEHVDKLIDMGVQMEQLATHDKLTGALNRVNMYSIIQRMIDDKRPFLVGLLDIDGFKGIDDTYGHQYGDDVLHACAQTMIRVLDETCGGNVFRFGGDEFLIIFLTDNREDTETVYAKINRRLIDFTQKTKKLSITLSAGIAHRNDGETIDDLIRIADKRLYLAKGKGRNCIVSSEDDSACAAELV